MPSNENENAPAAPANSSEKKEQTVATNPQGPQLSSSNNSHMWQVGYTYNYAQEISINDELPRQVSLKPRRRSSSQNVERREPGNQHHLNQKFPPQGYRCEYEYHGQSSNTQHLNYPAAAHPSPHITEYHPQYHQHHHQSIGQSVRHAFYPVESPSPHFTEHHPPYHRDTVGGASDACSKYMEQTAAVAAVPLQEQSSAYHHQGDNYYHPSTQPYWHEYGYDSNDQPYYHDYNPNTNTPMHYGSGEHVNSVPTNRSGYASAMTMSHDVSTYASGSNSYVSMPMQYDGYQAQPGRPYKNKSNSDAHISGPEGANLFVFHIPTSMSNADLAAIFAPYGTVVSATIATHSFTGRGRGFGFVSYDSCISSAKAIKHLNGHVVTCSLNGHQVSQLNSEIF